MIRKTVWSIVTIVLAASAATAADIRRVVTGLDDSNKAIVLFDSRLILSPGKSGIPQTNLWMTDSSPAGFSFRRQRCQADRPIAARQRHQGHCGRVSAARSRRRSQDGPQSHDEGRRRSRASEGPSREASNDASHPNR